MSQPRAMSFDFSIVETTTQKLTPQERAPTEKNTYPDELIRLDVDPNCARSAAASDHACPQREGRTDERNGERSRGSVASRTRVDVFFLWNPGHESRGKKQKHPPTRCTGTATGVESYQFGGHHFNFDVRALSTFGFPIDHFMFTQRRLLFQIRELRGMCTVMSASMFLVTVLHSVTWSDVRPLWNTPSPRMLVCPFGHEKDRCGLPSRRMTLGEMNT